VVGEKIVRSVLWIVKVLYSHLCPGYQVFAQVMNARPQGGRRGRIPFTPH